MIAVAALTPRPPLGWNSFDCYGCAATMRDLLPNLEVMAARLQPFGYEYFVVDNGWFAEYDIAPGERYPRETHAREVHLDPYGRYLPSTRSFPDELGVPTGCRQLHDIWRDRELGAPGPHESLRLDIGPDGVVFCRYEAHCDSGRDADNVTTYGKAVGHHG